MIAAQAVERPVSQRVTYELVSLRSKSPRVPQELEIYRRSAPYGTVREHGLYFVAFSADRTRFDKMLARMFGTTGDGLHDHLTDFSRPVSGAYYFAPSLQALAALA